MKRCQPNKCAQGRGHLLFLLACLHAQLQAADVSGTISANTTWTTAGSPYNLVAYTRVNYGATLTIDPGVNVNGNGNQLQVFGILNASGSTTSRIVFDNVLVVPGSNAPSQPHSIILRDAHLFGGSLYAPRLFGSYGTLTMEHCHLENPTSYIDLWYPTGDCLIRHNVFGGNFPRYRSLIVVDTYGTNTVWIKDNVFCQIGAAVENHASYDTSATIITGNTFLNANYPTLILPSGYDSAKMIATNNYWNTVDTNVINEMIFDKSDDTNSADYISYMPFLTAPNPSAARVSPPTVVLDGTRIDAQSLSARGSANIGMTTIFPSGWLFYTLDGTDPTSFGVPYTAPFTVNRTSALRIVAYSADFMHSVARGPIDIIILPTLKSWTEG